MQDLHSQGGQRHNSKRFIDHIAAPTGLLNNTLQYLAKLHFILLRLSMQQGGFKVNSYCYASITTFTFCLLSILAVPTLEEDILTCNLITTTAN